jgi:hypothetical protein
LKIVPPKKGKKAAKEDGKVYFKVVCGGSEESSSTVSINGTKIKNTKVAKGEQAFLSLINKKI